MRYRTAVKTGRTAVLQAESVRPGSFVRYTAMVEQLSHGYVRPLPERLEAPGERAASRVPVLAVCILALLFVAATFVASRAQAQEKSPPVADVAITQGVESAFAKDAGLATMDIRVQTQDGVVTLSGFVRSLEDIAKAGALAHAVRGVSAVRNDLRVANRPSRA